MSTKIFNGWLIRGTDMVALRKKCQKLSKEVKQIATTVMAERAAWMATRLLDQYAMQGKKLVLDDDEISLPMYRTLLSFTMMQGREEAVKAHSSPVKLPFDLGCSLVAFPMKWKGEEITPITFYDQTGGNRYVPAFERIIKPKPFPYWNNTDQPEGVTRGQWAERERLWDKAMGDGIPAENGFAFDLIVPISYPFDYRAEVLDELRKIKWLTRIARTAERYQRRRAMLVIARKIKKEGREVTAKDFGKLRDWERGPAGCKALEKGKELARERLKRRITKSDVAVKVSSIAKKAPPEVESVL